MDNIMTRVHLYIPSMVISVENWLCEMSESGWKLISVNGIKFTFRKSLPKKREYFIYSGFDLSKGISNDYFAAKRLYEKKRSELNKSSNTVFEIDETKKDEKLQSYFNLRNKYYLRHYIAMTILWLLFSACLIAVISSSELFLIFAVMFFLILIYNIVSIALLCINIRKNA